LYQHDSQGLMVADSGMRPMLLSVTFGSFGRSIPQRAGEINISLTGGAEIGKISNVRITSG
jgi:hypothetical protein